MNSAHKEMVDYDKIFQRGEIKVNDFRSQHTAYIAYETSKTLIKDITVCVLGRPSECPQRETHASDKGHSLCDEGHLPPFHIRACSQDIIHCWRLYLRRYTSTSLHVLRLYLSTLQFGDGHAKTYISSI